MASQIRSTYFFVAKPQSTSRYYLCRLLNSIATTEYATAIALSVIRNSEAPFFFWVDISLYDL